MKYRNFDDLWASNSTIGTLGFVVENQTLYINTAGGWMQIKVA